MRVVPEGCGVDFHLGVDGCNAASISMEGSITSSAGTRQWVKGKGSSPRSTHFLGELILEARRAQKGET